MVGQHTVSILILTFGCNSVPRSSVNVDTSWARVSGSGFLLCTGWFDLGLVFAASIFRYLLYVLVEVIGFSG